MTRNKGIARSTNAQAKPDAQMGHADPVNGGKSIWKKISKHSSAKKRRRHDREAGRE